MPLPKSEPSSPPQPWAAFLDELDSRLTAPVTIHCIGGFVLTTLYGLPRMTGDVDYVSVLPFDRIAELQAVAGLGSPLHHKYKLYLQHVAVNTMPENYESRLTEPFPGRFKRLRIFVPDAYDLILSKLERNSQKDREDIEYIARAIQLNATLLRERYRQEQRPNLLSKHEWHDATLEMWIESYFCDS